MNKLQKKLQYKINTGKFHPNEGIKSEVFVKLLTDEELKDYLNKVKENETK